MTKIRKWWKKICFWMKIKATLASIGVGSEITLFIMDSHSGWKIAAAIATVLSILITNLIEDKNNNGIVDLFEDDEQQ